MNISISEKNQEHIRQMIESGAYRTPDEVIGAALRLLDERDRELGVPPDTFHEEVGESPPDEELMTELRRRVETGEEQLRNGQFADYDEAGLEELKERIKREGRARKQRQAKNSG